MAPARVEVGVGRVIAGIKVRNADTLLTGFYLGRVWLACISGGRIPARRAHKFRNSYSIPIIRFQHSSILALSNQQTIRDLRRELLTAESRILELQDRIAAKQTEQADAVALLGDAELVLENKITYIMELDRSLNLRIRELEEECDRKTDEIDRRGDSLLAAEKNQRELNVKHLILMAN